jgi:hypothetical protein
MLSDTFAGIAPSSVPGFVVVQLGGGALGLAAVGYLFPRPRLDPSLDAPEVSR